MTIRRTSDPGDGSVNRSECKSEKLTGKSEDSGEEGNSDSDSARDAIESKLRSLMSKKNGNVSPEAGIDEFRKNLYMGIYRRIIGTRIS
jgi:hypothetical protein